MTRTSQIKDIIQESKAEITEFKTNVYHKRFFINITAEDYAEYVKVKGELIFRRKGEDKHFIIDDDNREVLNQVFYYLVGSKKFEGDLKKGLWIYGKGTGTGKSTILEIICNLINDLYNRHINVLLSKEIASYIEEYSYEYFENRILLIDDLGREQKDLNIYGNKTKPVPEIMFRRERTGAWTMATSQRPIMFEDFKKAYGDVVVSRMNKMFNQIMLNGPDRRNEYAN